MTESLSKSEERYKAFIKTSTEGIWRFELEKPLATKESIEKQLEHCYKYAYLAECNDACAKMYGYNNASEMVGARLTDMLIPTDKQNIAYLTAFIKSHYKLINTESKELAKDGSIRYFSNSFIGIVEDGFVKRAWGTQRDITREKEIEEAKDNFILNASHELRTPIAGIRGLVIMLLEGNFGQVPKTQIKPLRMIETSIDKLNHLTTNILDIMKIDSNKLKFSIEKVDISALLKELKTEFQALAQIKKTTLSFESGNESIQSDPQIVKNILYNLLDNAIKFTEKGNVNIKVKKKDNHILIAVSDTGLGISEQDKKKIFKRFEQITSQIGGKPQGTGLGLYIAKELAKKIQGDIVLEKSQPKKGSTFVLELPIVYKNE
jgi:PAS domain S-box-containing protein